MGSGRLASPTGGPQEALACGLALGRPATAAVRWADRLREKEAFPMWPAITPPNTHTHSRTPCTPPPSTQMLGIRGATSCAEANKGGGSTSLGLRLSDIVQCGALIESICERWFNSDRSMCQHHHCRIKS